MNNTEWFCETCGKVWRGRKECCGIVPVQEFNPTLRKHLDSVISFSNGWLYIKNFIKTIETHPVYIEARDEIYATGNCGAAGIFIFFFIKKLMDRNLDLMDRVIELEGEVRKED